jgi:hypothetical protein
MLRLRPRTNAVTSWVMPIDGPPINSHARSIPIKKQIATRIAIVSTAPESPGWAITSIPSTSDTALAGTRAGACCRGGRSGSFDAMDDLVALITGANKGIGKEIARQLAGAGLTVYVGSRDAGRGKRAVQEIGGQARLLVLDVTDGASIAEAARQVGTWRCCPTTGPPGSSSPGTGRRSPGDRRHLRCAVAYRSHAA